MNFSSIPVNLENLQSIVTIDPFGGAITSFRFKNTPVNPLSFSFSKDQMPANNKNGAPYQGHFICLGRWGEPSPGEINAGVPNHGQFANIFWNIQNIENPHILKMNATAALEGLQIEREILLDKENAVIAVKEVIQNINPLGRLFNVVQHPTIAAPFLDSTTIIDSNGSRGFDQAFFKKIDDNEIQWPVAKDSQNSSIDLSTSASPYNAVFSFVVNTGCEYGWVTAFSPTHQLLFGYIWKRTDYPWIHFWQHYTNGSIYYRGIEFGTAGIHQPFKEILNTYPILFGEKTLAFIDAGESVTKKYYSFLHPAGNDFEGVEDIRIVNGTIQVKGKKDIAITINLSTELSNELSK